MTRSIGTRSVFNYALAALMGAGLTVAAIAATPLKNQFFDSPIDGVDRPSWVMPRHAQWGWGRHGHWHGRHGPGWHGRWHGAGGWRGAGGCAIFQGTFDPADLETLNGQVLKVARWGPGQGTWLQVKTETETLTVHLGPGWFLDQQKVAIAPNDTIEVTGIRETWGEEPTLIATTFKSGDNTVELLDEKGFPVWHQGPFGTERSSSLLNQFNP